MQDTEYDGVYVYAKCFVTMQMQWIRLPVRVGRNVSVQASPIGCARDLEKVLCYLLSVKRPEGPIYHSSPVLFVLVLSPAAVGRCSLS